MRRKIIRMGNLDEVLILKEYSRPYNKLTEHSRESRDPHYPVAIFPHLHYPPLGGLEISHAILLKNYPKISEAVPIRHSKKSKRNLYSIFRD